MRINSPPDLHYPITVTALLKPVDAEIQRSTPLFAYTYQSIVAEVDKYGDEHEVRKAFPTEFQSEIEGTLLTWRIKVGDIIEKGGVPLLEIDEPCRHETQFGGLCVDCGKDMTTTDYNTTQRNDARATVSMVPRHSELKVSAVEAGRESDNDIRRLLNERKLSLVVDLDQTVIHATVDPTVGEWQSDPDNPNHESLQDVRAFQLLDGGPASKSCWYYVKLRPGLQDFLEDISKKYELHIYTMGTGPYAQAITKIIDPDRRFFGDRIITRDESGSTTVKNLLKVFPMDQKMVVIIDDRGDVWQWSKNLIKVLPYEFFRGIGDINASFLPKRLGVVTPQPGKVRPIASKPITTEIEVPLVQNGDSTVVEDEVRPDPSPEPSAIQTQLAALTGDTTAAVIEEQLHDQEELLATQISERPLLKSQKVLDDRIDEEDAHQDPHSDTVSEAASEASQKHRHKLLNDDDNELLYLQQSLERIHKAFYKDLDSAASGPQDTRIAQLKGQKAAKKPPLADLGSLPDIGLIMPMIKARVLGDVHICFTGVIPQNIIHQTSDFGMWAQSFGAIVSPSLTKSTTHVIAHRDRRTSKVRQAAKHPRIKIVTPEWLYECFAKWEHVDESPYTIEVERDTIMSHDSLPFDSLPDGILTSDDEGDGDLALPEGYGTDTVESDADELKSPVEQLTNQEWQDIDDELKEFMEGSDTEDGLSDEGGESDASLTESVNGHSSKRKRGLSSASQSEVEESDTGSVNGTTGSKLQRRKKRALDRNTSLSNVSYAAKSSGVPSPEANAPHQDQSQATTNGDDVDEDDEFAKAMMAEFERDEDE